MPSLQLDDLPARGLCPIARRGGFLTQNKRLSALPCYFRRRSLDRLGHRVLSSRIERHRQERHAERFGEHVSAPIKPSA